MTESGHHFVRNTCCILSSNNLTYSGTLLQKDLFSSTRDICDTNCHLSVNSCTHMYKSKWKFYKVGYHHGPLRIIFPTIVQCKIPFLFNQRTFISTCELLSNTLIPYSLFRLAISPFSQRFYPTLYCDLHWYSSMALLFNKLFFVFISFKLSPYTPHSNPLEYPLQMINCGMISFVYSQSLPIFVQYFSPIFQLNCTQWITR